MGVMVCFMYTSSAHRSAALRLWVHRQTNLANVPIISYIHAAEIFCSVLKTPMILSTAIITMIIDTL